MPYDVNIRQITTYGLLNLRARADSRALINKILGFELPVQPNTTEARPELLAMWLGPDAWLLRMPDRDVLHWQSALYRDIDSTASAITVVTDAYVIVELTGRDVSDVLSQGAEFDTHDRAFQPGECAQIRFAKTQIILHRIDATPTFHLYVSRSYEHYLMLWLQAARGR